MLVIYPVGEHLSRKNLSWCRELASRKICNTPMNECFSVYGIVDGEGTYLPDSIDPIRDHDPAIGRLVSLLFHTTLALASRIVLDTGPTIGDCQSAWCYRQPLSPLTESTIDMNDPQDAGVGSIINLPAWVGKSIVLTSFLLYLPRVWYNLAQMQYTKDQQYMKASGGSTFLNIIAGYLAVPLYQMPQGGAGFWSFLDFLITANSLESPEEAKALLLNNIDCDGYNTWFEMNLQSDYPRWCDSIVERNKLYNKYGATAMVNLKIRGGTL